MAAALASNLMNLP
jgi:hypothetical protein